MHLIFWAAIALVALIYLTVYSVASIGGTHSAQERQRDDARQSGHARLESAAQAVVNASNGQGKVGMSVYIPFDKLVDLRDALDDDRAAYPESKFDVTG
ncbi:hypothetical protein Q0M94_28380 (plasmid) [Deinococcus radiomollis]|uniref:hypothetical protein n=1 Tax=Deinococcus radiomollis TaxID=468916 RepID=UPI0038913DC3